MPNWLHYLLSWWTTPFTILAAVVGVGALLGLRGRRLAILAATTALTLAIVAAWKSGPPIGLLDLTIYMGAARGWLDGGSLYSFRDQVFNLGATYPPIGPILFVPFAPLNDERREITFTALSMAALGGAAWCTTGLVGLVGPRRVDWTLWGFAAAVVTTPVWLTIRQGQINVILWFLVLVDIAALPRRRPWGGMAIGLATAIKLTPGLFIIWLATTRRWTATLRAVGTACAVTALGWLLAPDDSRRYWTELLWDTGRVGDLADDRNNSVMGVLARFLPEGGIRTAPWILLVGIVVVIALVRATVPACRSPRRGRRRSAR
ncbi:MAG: glycosyltransferase family 87 protein [Acidimicrobiia bacterium]